MESSCVARLLRRRPCRTLKIWLALSILLLASGASSSLLVRRRFTLVSVCFGRSRGLEGAFLGRAAAEVALEVVWKLQ